jgi:dGTPase
MMDWQTLLTTERLDGTVEASQPGYRSVFQEDWDRIIFSSAFRRLQRKTQVHSFPSIDYIHTRLTHSLETASVGRSLGFYVGHQLQHVLPQEITAHDVAAIVSTSCLMHDIGNPPFGHAGEGAISEWFERFFNQQPEIDLSQSQKLDFTKFEGNAQGFRTVCKLQGASGRFGLNLTLSVLASTFKYPCFSDCPDTLRQEHVSRKKHNSNQAEREVFVSIFQRLGIPFKTIEGHLLGTRHPLAFLVEAADDICYRIIDLEDAYKLNLLSLSDVEDLMQGLLKALPNTHREEPDKRIVAIRAHAIGGLVELAAETFMKNLPCIMAGEFTQDLLSAIESPSLKGTLSAMQHATKDRVFDVRNREMGVVGYKILFGLLDHFVPAMLEFEKKRETARMSQFHQKLLSTMSFDTEKSKELSLYELLLIVTDYIAGMTDVYAKAMYQKIMGIQF